jgi:hypothetical protein
VSSAQSKCGGTGVGHSSTGLSGSSTRDGGRKTAVVGNPGTWAVVDDAEGGETSRLWHRFRAGARGGMHSSGDIDSHVDGDVVGPVDM